MNEKTSKKCYKLEVHLERGAEEFLPEDIYHYARNGLWIEDKGYSSIIKCYPENIELFLNTLKDSGLKIKDLSIEEEDVPDYNELTKRYFKSIKVSGVRIVPPWAKNIPNGAIIIDPGMAFGTGRHESTKIMIKLMQKIDFKEREVIDIGCGSAILAIYASMLGAKSVLAIDNDFDAVISAKKNINLNRRENIKVVCADVNDIKGSFDIVLANLDIRTFQKNKNKLCSFLKHKSYLVLSGVLKKEIKLIEEIFSELRIVAEECKDSWVGMILEHATTHLLTVSND